MRRHGNAGRNASDAIGAIARWAARLLAAVSVALVTGRALAEPMLPILVYHEIRTGADGPADGPTAISLSRFESQMRYLHERGYVALTTDQVIDFIKEGKAPSGKIVAIHFDDGWKSALADNSSPRTFTSATLAGVPCTVCTSPESASVPMCTFMPKYHCLPFLVWCICGSRVFLAFFVDEGALMIVASTIVPLPTNSPRSEGAR